MGDPPPSHLLLFDRRYRPNFEMSLLKRDIDVSRVFLAYLSLQGDCNRTAMACDMAVEDVRDLAAAEQWSTKIKQFAALREEDQHFQVGLNRVLNFVQARQLSGLVDAVIKEMSDPEKMMELLTTTTMHGSTFNTKPLTDLVRAAEAIQAMTSRALGDIGGGMEGDKTSGGSIGLSVARALNAVATNVGVDPVGVVQKSLEVSNVDDSRHSGAETPASS